VARDKAARESADGHEKARRDAVAGSFAARKAGVRCAAASRRAVSAASIARKIASRCEAAGGDGVAAAAAAREAAERCVADATLDGAVPLADAAALDAREAAASCDAALLSPLDADEEFIHKMRGWLMTVATLFVGIAYQAVIQPPAWMTTCFKPTHGRKHKDSFSCTKLSTCLLWQQHSRLCVSHFSHSEKCNRSLKKNATATSCTFLRKKCN
jgi:hypothetical protein